MANYIQGIGAPSRQSHLFFFKKYVIYRLHSQGFIKAVFTTAKRYLSPLKKRCKRSPFSERNYLLKQNISNIVCVFVFVRLKFNKHIRIYPHISSSSFKRFKNEKKEHDKASHWYWTVNQSTMSHNAKYYVKRIRKKDATGMPTIAKLFTFARMTVEIKDWGGTWVWNDVINENISDKVLTNVDKIWKFY